jgi:hypothetical protein
LLAVGAVERHAGFGDPIDVRALDITVPVSAELGTQIVDGDKENVRPVSGVNTANQCESREGEMTDLTKKNVHRGSRGAPNSPDAERANGRGKTPTKPRRRAGSLLSDCHAGACWAIEHRTLNIQHSTSNIEIRTAHNTRNPSKIAMFSELRSWKLDVPCSMFIPIFSFWLRGHSQSERNCG